MSDFRRGSLNPDYYPTDFEENQNVIRRNITPTTTLGTAGIVGAARYGMPALKYRAARRLKDAPIKIESGPGGLAKAIAESGQRLKAEETYRKGGAAGQLKRDIGNLRPKRIKENVKKLTKKARRGLTAPKFKWQRRLGAAGLGLAGLGTLAGIDKAREYYFL